MEKNPIVELARQIGQPINVQLPIPVELSAIADTFVAEVGEKVWRYTAFDSSLDTVLSVDANGAITLVKRSPTGDAELSFSGLNSKMEYVLIDDILGETDNTQVLGRRKASITRSMDKRELYAILTAILAKTGGYLPGVNPREHTVVSANDLYDVIVAMKHLIEDYGDSYILLMGSTASNKLDTYDKDNVATFEYKIGIKQVLRDMNITPMKVFGGVELTDGGGETAIMDSKKLILIAKNSRIAEGKPIKFCRRKISADIAKLMGAEVDEAQRALVVNPTPVIKSGIPTLAYAVYGYESNVFTITNPMNIAIADATIIL